ncbi:hypothetical protein JB92DRAFT_340550 [Gautieria morchelliformis]|nr:hypothetical protein JB92DRAFT_340550 [Gautieria morchelliformis]
MSSNSARSGATALTTTTSSSALMAADVELDIEECTLHLAVEETFEEIGWRWMLWAANGHAIRVGELILIVDSDTLYRRIASGQGCDRGLPTMRTTSLLFSIISRLHEEREAPWRYQPLHHGAPSMARACMCTLHRLLLFSPQARGRGRVNDPA